MGSWSNGVYTGDATDEDVTGTAADESIYLFDGEDTADGGGGNDRVEGGLGADQLLGGDGDDTLYAGSIFQSDKSADTLTGGSGADSLVALDLTAAVEIDGGTGADIAVLGRNVELPTTTAISFALARNGSNVFAGGVATMLVAGVERVRIYGAAGADSFAGGSGDDTLIGFGGDDVLVGGAGDDSLDAGTGRLDIDGGRGIDTAAFDLSGTDLDVVLAPGSGTLPGTLGEYAGIERWERIFLGSGDDTVAMGNLGGEVSSGGGDDSVTGGNGEDAIYGGTGDDTLRGGKGGDSISADTNGFFLGERETTANPGDDSVDAGDGNDIVFAGTGADTVSGGNGDDIVGYLLEYGAAADLAVDAFDGGGGTDELFVDLPRGFTGAVEVIFDPDLTQVKLDGAVVIAATAFERIDVRIARSSSNFIVGGALGDTVVMGDSNDPEETTNDNVDLGGGDDSFEMNRGSDSVRGGAGDDTVDIQLGGSDDVDAGAGDDLIIVRADPTSPNPADGHSVYDGGSGRDTIWVYEQASNFFFDGDVLQTGGRTADLLRYEVLVFLGSSAATAVTGTDRDENFLMGSGADTLDAGDGDDTVDGGTGFGGGADDELDGGDGTDWLSYENEYGARLVVTLNGDEPAVARTFSTGTGLLAAEDTVVNFEHVLGSPNADSVAGDDGDNVFDGARGDDTLSGGDGDDSLAGNFGADSLRGGTGNDTLSGSVFHYPSDDPDSFVGGAEPAADTLDGGTGLDTADYSNATTTVRVALDGVNFVAVREAGAGTDRIRNVENVIGGEAGDQLTGDLLRNKLVGFLGDDTLQGGIGRDTLHGGDGRDAFVFAEAPTTANADTIMDFRVADDTIHLRKAIYAELARGALDPDAFWRSAAGVAHDRDDRIIYESDTGILRYDADGNRAGDAVMIVTLDPSLAMTAADFLTV